MLLVGVLLIPALAIYTVFNTSTHSGASTEPVVKHVLMDNDHNVRYLSVDIKGQPYVCNPNMGSMGEILIHCAPEGAAP
jgi:hypothetical protein